MSVIAMLAAYFALGVALTESPMRALKGVVLIPAFLPWRMAIEILGLLDIKTRGNLTAEERQMLEQVLYELRLRFVEAKAGEKRIIEP